MEQLDIPSTNKNVPTTLARCEEEKKQCLSGGEFNLKMQLNLISYFDLIQIDIFKKNAQPSCYYSTNTSNMPTVASERGVMFKRMASVANDSEGCTTLN